MPNVTLPHVNYSGLKVTYSYPKVTYSEPRVTYSDPKVAHSDPTHHLPLPHLIPSWPLVE